MKVIIHTLRLQILTSILLARFIVPALAQDVSIPDSGLNDAIRAALQKPDGPLTEQDLLSLTNLNASSRNISRVDGLEKARNLTELFLNSNQLTNFSLPNELTNLETFGLSFNPLTQCTIPSGLTNLRTIIIEGSSLANLSLPAGLTGLKSLQLFQNQLTNFALPDGLPNLTLIDIGFNSLVQCSISDGRTNLDTLFLEGNQLTDFTLPTGLTALTHLDLTGNKLTSFALSADMTNLLVFLISANQLTNLSLPGTLTQLNGMDLDFNRLQSLALPVGMTNLASVLARDNQLTHLTIPPGMTNLTLIDLQDNQLSNLTLSADLTRLTFLRVSGNQLTNLTFPPDLTNLVTIVLQDNPLATFVVSEEMATNNLQGVVVPLRAQGVNVFTYPLAVQLIRAQPLIGAFQFVLTGPPGDYAVLASTNLSVWNQIGAMDNRLGALVFTDGKAHFSPQKFYRALLQNTPENMVFIPPTTFMMGSPANEFGHQPDEGPPTSVTLSRGFWISKFLVTQGDYLAVTGTNPSGFPGDLNRPVESVSWFAASNYCAQLTEQDLAAKQIPPGSHYRLPTEAEWECAARAGSSTRFYYGDDLDGTNLTNYAWYGANSGLTPHAVGQKLPNAFGLYDMAGNVWEWCQDWYGDYLGGSVTDPRGPATNPIGWKVIRGGAWEASEFDCRSASRGFEPASPFISDFIIGFRVVLVIDADP